MKYGLLVLLILTVVVLLILLFCCIRRKWAYRKVLRLTTEEKCRRLNAALSPYGFCYRPDCDCFCSTRDAWQKQMGYCRFYDESAPLMNMVMDCEPIYFTYDNRNWMIELWKGQYGMTAGAEIGVYATKEYQTGAPQELFYYGVAEQEELKLSYTLKRGNKVLLEREERHWWLTGFCLGSFVWPHELCMEVKIQFQSNTMKNAFYEGLLRAGYRPEEIQVNCCCVAFCFCIPKTSQPDRCRLCCLKCIQRRNRRRCQRFWKVTGRFSSTLDRVTWLAYCFPVLYRRLIRFGRFKSLKKAHKKYCRKYPGIC